MWHTAPLLGNERQTNNKTTAAATQRPARNNGSAVRSSVFYVVHTEAVSLIQISSVSECSAVQRVGWQVSELVS
jgi:hypothetical protein